MKPSFASSSLIRSLSAAIVLGSLSSVAVVATSFAWSQAICNPTTGQTFQGNGAAPLTTEALYYGYINDHRSQGAYEMSAGATCVKLTPTPTEVVHPTVAPTEVVHPTVVPTEVVHPTVVPTEVVHPTVVPTEVVHPTVVPTEVVHPTTSPTDVHTTVVPTTSATTAPTVATVAPPATQATPATSTPTASPAPATPATATATPSTSTSSTSSTSPPAAAQPSSSGPSNSGPSRTSTCVAPPDLRSEAESKSHPLTAAERCQLASQSPPPASDVSAPTTDTAQASPVTPQPAAPVQPERAIADVQAVASPSAAPEVQAVVADSAMPAEAVQPMPVEVAGVSVEVPTELPDAGDGSTAEMTLDDLEP